MKQALLEIETLPEGRAGEILQLPEFDSEEVDGHSEGDGVDVNAEDTAVE